MNINPFAWLFWFSAAVIFGLISRNPLYALILLAVSRMAAEVYGRNESLLKFSFTRMAAIILTFSVIYTTLFIHVGENVVLTLPGWPLIGGQLTLEAMLDGLRNGLLLLALISIFLAFNAIMPVSVLVRLIPPSLKDIGVVILVAVTYVPETRRQLVRIREAQAIRGHEIKGLSDWRPILIPLLVSGFERSVNLSETIVARGFGSTTSNGSSLARKSWLFGILTALFVGWLLLLFGYWYGWLLIVFGLLAIAFTLVKGTKGDKRTRYRHYPWAKEDTLLTIAAIISLALLLLPLTSINRESLSYSPYSTGALPEFDIIVGLGLAFLAFPMFLGVIRTVKESEND